MLSDLFQERNLTPAPSLGTTLATAKDGGADKEVKVAGDTDEATEREIVDILMAADLGLCKVLCLDMLYCFRYHSSAIAEDEDDYEDVYDEKVYSNDGGNPNLIHKPKKKMELKAGLLREILSNKPKRHTFSGLYI